MKKSGILSLTLFFLLAASSINPIILVFASENDILTSATLTIEPNTVELGTTVKITMLIEPLPPTSSDWFNGLVVRVTHPNGNVETLGPFQTNTEGSTQTVYMPTNLGVYNLHLEYPGESFSNGTIAYQPATSLRMSLLVVSKLATPPPDMPPPAVLTAGALPSENSWAKKASMHEARGGLGVAVVNGKIYAIGGSTKSGLYPANIQGGFVGTNEEYDPIMDTWTYKSSMPTPRSDFAIAVYQNKIYCIGGAMGIHEVPWGGTVLMVPTFTMSGVNEVYDPATDTWETKTAAPASGMMMKATVFNNKIYLIDGDLNEVYDTATDTWVTKAPSPLGAEDFGPGGGNDYQLVVFGGKLHIAGGFSKSLVENTEFMTYNEGTDTWIKGATIPIRNYFNIAVAETTGATAPKLLYFVLSLRGMIPTTATAAYDLLTDQWVTAKAAPITRSNFGFASLNDKLFAIGGYTITSSGHFNASALNEEYTPIGYGTGDLPKPTSSPSPSSSQNPLPSEEPADNSGTQIEPVSSQVTAPVLAVIALFSLIAVRSTIYIIKNMLHRKTEK